MKRLQCHQTTFIWVVWLCPIQYIYMLTWSCSWMLAHVLLGTCRECSEEDKTEEGLVYATPPNTQTVCDSASYTTLCPYTPATTCAPIKCIPWGRKKTTYYYTCSREAHPTHTHKQKFWYHCRFMVLVRCSNMECEHIRKMQMKKKGGGSLFLLQKCVWGQRWKSGPLQIICITLHGLHLQYLVQYVEHYHPLQQNIHLKTEKTFRL